MAPILANPSDQVWKIFVKPIEKRYFIMKKVVVIGGGTMG